MAEINTQGPPDQAALDAQLVQMLAAVPRGGLRSEYEDVNAAAKHSRSLLNQLSFKPNPEFTWVSAEGTIWSTNKLKHNSCRKLAICLWKDGVIRLLNEPVLHNSGRQVLSNAAVPSANANSNHIVSQNQVPANAVVPSDNFGSSPSLEDMIQAEAAQTSSLKRRGVQPMLMSKAPRAQGNQDITQSFNRAPSHLPTASSSCTRMTSSEDQSVLSKAHDNNEGEDNILLSGSSSAIGTRRNPIILSEDKEDERSGHPEQPEQVHHQSCGLFWLAGSAQNPVMMIGDVELKYETATNTIPMSQLIRLRAGAGHGAQSFVYRRVQTDITNFAGAAMVKTDGRYYVPLDVARRWLKKRNLESRASLFLSWADGSVDLKPIAAELGCCRCKAPLNFANQYAQRLSRNHLGLHLNQATLQTPGSIRCCLVCRTIFPTVHEFEDHSCPGPLE